MNNKLNDMSDTFYSLSQISSTRFLECIGHKLSIVCVFFLLATINVASANDDKFSLGLSLSHNQIEYSSPGNTDNGFKLDLGYSINDIFSVELSYFKLGDISYNFIDPEPIGITPPDQLSALKIQTDAWDVSLLAKHKMNKFSVYARLGWFMSNTKQQINFVSGVDQQSKLNDSALSYGLGAGYDINKHFSINLDHTVSETNDFNNGRIQITSLGIKYRF